MTAIIISSCDQFSDCHAATLACMDKFWMDCPFKVYTLSNNKPWGKYPICVGADRGFGANLRSALDHLSDEFVLLWLEDMLITRTITPDNMDDIQFAIDNMSLNFNIGAIRLGQGGEKCFMPDAITSAILRDSDYRISTSPTLWRITYLREILMHCGETAWEFEHKGTEYSRTLPQEVWTMYGNDETKRPFRCYYTAITRGKWDRNAVEWLKRDVGIEVDVSRGFMP